MNILVALLHLYCLFTADAEQQAEDQGRTAYASTLRSRPSIDRPPAFPGSLNDVIDGAPSAPDPQPPANIRTIYESQEEISRMEELDPPSYEGVAPGETSSGLGTTAGAEGSIKNVVPNSPFNRRSLRSPAFPNHQRLTSSKSSMLNDKRDRISDSNEIDIKEAIFRVLSKLISESYASPHSTSLTVVRPDGSDSQEMGVTTPRSYKSRQRESANDDMYQQPEPPKLQSYVQGERRDTEISGSSNLMNGYYSKDQQISFPSKSTNFNTSPHQTEKYTRQNFQEILTPPPRFWMSDERKITGPIERPIFKHQKTNADWDVGTPFEEHKYKPWLFREYSQPEKSPDFEGPIPTMWWNNIKPSVKNDDEYRTYNGKQPLTITMDIQDDGTDNKELRRGIDLIQSKGGKSDQMESIAMQLKEAFKQIIQDIFKRKNDFDYTDKEEKDVDPHTLREKIEKFNKYIPFNVDTSFPFVGLLEELYEMKNYMKAQQYRDKKMIEDNGWASKYSRSPVTPTREEKFYSDKIKHEVKSFPFNEYQKIWQPMAETQTKSSSSYFKAPQHYMEKIGKFLDDLKKLYNNPIPEKDNRGVKMTLTQDYSSLTPGVVEEINAGGGSAPGKHEGGGLK